MNRIIDEFDEEREVNGKTLPVHVIGMELDFKVKGVMFDVAEWRSLSGGPSRIMVTVPDAGEGGSLEKQLEAYEGSRKPRGLVLNIRSDEQSVRATCVTCYELTTENMILFAPARAVFGT